MKAILTRWKDQAVSSSKQIQSDLIHVKQFASDGCTGVPDFIFTECCENHDIDYEMAWVSRLRADNNLFRCMKKKLKATSENTGWMWCLPYVYWLGVRVFGGSRYQGNGHG